MALGNERVSVITRNPELLFDSVHLWGLPQNTGTVLRDHEDLLQGVVNLLRGLHGCTIAGMTSKEGTIAANKFVAVRRANAFRHWLLRHGAPTLRMSVDEDNPIIQPQDNNQLASQWRGVRIMVSPAGFWRPPDGPGVNTMT
jgi:hypothetical protein